MRRDKKKNIIDSTQCLCDHGCLHLMKLRNSNYPRKFIQSNEGNIDKGLK